MDGGAKIAEDLAALPLRMTGFTQKSISSQLPDGTFSGICFTRLAWLIMTGHFREREASRLSPSLQQPHTLDVYQTPTPPPPSPLRPPHKPTRISQHPRRYKRHRTRNPQTHPKT